jgi:hypothetical protein
VCEYRKTWSLLERKEPEIKRRAFTKEKMDEIGFRLERSPRKSLGALHRRSRLKISGFKFKVRAISEKYIQHGNVNNLRRCKECLCNSRDLARYLVKCGLILWFTDLLIFRLRPKSKRALCETTLIAFVPLARAAEGFFGGSSEDLSVYVLCVIIVSTYLM